MLSSMFQRGRRRAAAVAAGGPDATATPRTVAPAGRSPQDILAALAAGTAALTGQNFFQELVRQLGRTLGVRYALVSEADGHGPGQVRILASWWNGRPGEPGALDVRGTPCEIVLGGQSVRYVNHVAQHFPEDRTLAAMGVESYLALPLLDGAGEVLGHVAVMDDHPMAEDPVELPVLQIFAARAASELERLHADRALRQTQERLLRAEAAATLGRMAAGLAHELSTPVAVLRNNADVTRRAVRELRDQPAGEANGRYRKLIDVLEETSEGAIRAAERLGGVLRQVGEFARIEESERRPVALNECVAAAVATIAPRLAAGVCVEQNLATVPEVTGRAPELTQALVELLRFSASAVDGEGRITVRTAAAPAGVRVTVADDGATLSEQERAKLFDIGFTLRGRSIRLRMGLVHALTVVREHGGDIAVGAGPVGGTVLDVTLPAAG